MASDSAAPRRSAHRPSRQETVLDAAEHLCAVRPIDQVTVADIAAEADMTAAAVYYHYRSKDEVLLAVVRRYADMLSHRVRAELEVSASISDAIVALLYWCADKRDGALVYFVRAPGWNPTVEGARHQGREELLMVFDTEIRRRQTLSGVAAPAVAATALCSLLEVAVVSWLTEDTVLAVLGRRRFAAEINELARDICAAGM